VTKGVIATPHRLAGEAGAQVLRDGGNAIDAAIAADAVLCVVYPHMTSVGGDLMAIVWPAGASAPVGLIGAGRSGEHATIEEVRSRGHETMPERGPLSVTVPGTVEAWGRLIERYGSVGMAAVLEPAAALARDGYIITEHLADHLRQGADLLGREPAAQALYPPMEAGMRLRNPDLASVLTDIGRTGINTFYRGAVGAAIAEALRRRDGFVTARDLATHRSQWVDPVSVEYRGLTVYELPPPTQGLTALAMLARLRRFDRHALEPGVEFVTAFKKIRDESYPLRDRYITDPDFSSAPLEPFLDPKHATVGGGGEVHDGGDTILSVRCRRARQPRFADPERGVRIRIGHRRRRDRDAAPEPRLLLQAGSGAREPARAEEAHDAHPHPGDGRARWPSMGDLRVDGRGRPAAAANPGLNEPH